MTVAEQVKLTAEQFMMLGEDPPGVRLELVHGEIKVSPSPSLAHSYVDTALRRILGDHVVKHDLGVLVGDVDTVLGEYNVRRPDVIFVAKARLQMIKGHGIPIPPDLCVEILSPGSATTDQVDKFALYAKHGVANYWLVDPKGRTLEGYRLENGEYVQVGIARGEERIALPPFSELVIPLKELWSPVG